MKLFIHKYKHALPDLLYVIIFFSWWKILERHVTTDYHIIHNFLDDYIPFCELFIIPYYTWFAFISATVLFFFFKDKREYYKLSAFLFVGMTFFLIVSTVWPNGHNLRPTELPRDNVFTQLVFILWKNDTPTNVWPSIHVYNSFGACLSLWETKLLQKKRLVCVAASIITLLISLSTVFLKQHSMSDVLSALVMVAIVYLLVYRLDLLPSVENTKFSKLFS